MKVRVTFDITDEQRIVLGIAARGEMQAATREEMEQQLAKYALEPINAGVLALRESSLTVISRMTENESI